MLQRKKINSNICSRFTTASDLENGTLLLTPKFSLHKKITETFQPLQKTLPDHQKTN